MRHLSTEDMVDLAEGSAEAEAVAHFERCAACREQVETLRVTLAKVEAGAADIPEPSPLFWDHLSARVRAAIADAPVAPAAPWWRIGWRPVAVAAGLFAALLLAVFLGRPEPMTPTAPRSATGMVPSPSVAEAVLPDDSLDWLSDLASGVEWDDAVLSADVADVAVGDLSNDERVELHRILQEALAGAGV